MSNTKKDVKKFPGNFRLGLKAGVHLTVMLASGEYRKYSWTRKIEVYLDHSYVSEKTDAVIYVFVPVSRMQKKKALISSFEVPADELSTKIAVENLSDLMDIVVKGLKIEKVVEKVTTRQMEETYASNPLYGAFS